ncbi:hypothetical protein [Flavisolibacter ginsenosidimutans]|uniref:Uncharacterized protein n=1 Tax=Flavisolibacter ginsenosidimutans TaxID=661481 RepID=A0A5B8UNN5_9BACT|nr:hypothetical protein [Flavisolibacter ginsenosidimutans]QEC57992.1 hypothetical protein FSB75_19455 [Flavisolibacter ginsenosidimutans]
MNNIDNTTVQKLGLRLSDKPINAQTAQASRIFEYPHLENVFVMESDLYGNAMPKDSCFLAFNGRNGLIGKHLSVATLVNSTVADIRRMVESNTDG